MFKDDLIISQIDEIKKYIDRFIEELSSYSNETCIKSITKQEKDFFSFISKQIIFLKELYKIYSSYEIKVLISDFYNYIVSIIKNEHRYIYVNERSIIENYTRLIVNVDTGEDYITLNVFNKLKSKKFVTLLKQDEFSLIKSEYAVSCEYIHGSKLLNDNLAYVFRECISNVVVFKNKNNYIQKIIKLIKIFNRLLVSTYPEFIDCSFYRRKSVLSYLIGSHNVDLLFSILNSKN